MTEPNNPVIRIREIPGLQQTQEKTIKEYDALNYILKRWNLAILPRELVYKEKVVHGYNHYSSNYQDFN
ncbi:MAG TPA: hypothetical protein VFI73_00450 [Candidatus Nitrosopolaris sp.]|nr:hypothetical protein [Candidatus Nitrosopolaris sp.]